MRKLNMSGLERTLEEQKIKTERRRGEREEGKGRPPTCCNLPILLILLD
jgi:hypothetical protein